MADDVGQFRAGGRTLKVQAGWPSGGRPPIFAGMSFFARLSPLRAYRDLRFFLASREPYELGFFAVAVAITSFVMFAFFKDSHVEKEYRPNIIYVQQWRADRSVAEIVAQQKIDQAAKEKADAEVARERAKTQAEFRRLDDRLKKLGI